MTSVDRDQAIERAVKQALRADPVRAVEACPDAETVAAWSARSLPDAERASLEAHLADCARCQALVAAFSRAEPEPAAPPSRWANWRLPWLIPVATAATAVAIWVATPDVPTEREPLERALTSSEPERFDDSTPPATAPDLARGTAAGERDAPATAPEAATSALQPRARENASATPQPVAAEARERQAMPSEAGRTAGAADTVAPGAPPLVETNRAISERVATAPATAPAAAPPTRQEAFQRAARAVAPIEIVSPDPSVRWRIAAGGNVERSTSGGATWTAVSVMPPALITAGASPDPQVCWLVGRAGAVRLSTDGGQFRAVAFPEAADLTGVRATSSRGAVVTTEDGRTFRTDDQGTTWTLVP